MNVVDVVLVVVAVAAAFQGFRVGAVVQVCAIIGFFAGGVFLLLFASAHRDVRQYGPDAAELDVTRRPRYILTFSHGAHHCLGAAAARMQSRVALTELLARCPDFEVDSGGIVWAGGSYVRRPLSVPVRIGR